MYSILTRVYFGECERGIEGGAFVCASGGGRRGLIYIFMDQTLNSRQAEKKWSSLR